MTLLAICLSQRTQTANETKTEYNAINAAVKQIDGEGNETTYTLRQGRTAADQKQTHSAALLRTLTTLREISFSVTDPKAM